MPWCPKCKAQYREGFQTCSDCHVTLISQLPEEPSVHTNKTESLPSAPANPCLLAEFTDGIKLQLAEGLLHSNGVVFYTKCLTPKKYPSQRGTLLNNDIYSIYVSFEDYNKASELTRLYLSEPETVQTSPHEELKPFMQKRKTLQRIIVFFIFAVAAAFFVYQVISYAVAK